MPLISIILLALSFIGYGLFESGMYSDYFYSNYNNQAIQGSAKEFAQFSDASVAYIQSVGLPLPNTQLTTKDLISVNLLPTTFPLKTPFGQSLIAEYVSDPKIPSALDVVIRTSGIVTQTQANKLVGSNSQYNIEYETGILANNEILKQIQGSTGQFYGLMDGNVINNIGSTQNITLPKGVNSSNNQLALYIVSPGQYGYWLIQGNIYGDRALWSDIEGSQQNQSNGGAGSPQLKMSGFNQPYLSSIGFSYTCPSVAQNLGNLGNGQSVNNNLTLHHSWTGNASQAPLFCVPAFKGQINNFNYGPVTQILNYNNNAMYVYANMQYNNTYYYNPQVFSPYNGYNSSASYVSPTSISGLNENLIATGGFVAAVSPFSPMPNTEVIPQNLPDYVSGIGINLKVQNSQGTYDNYQIELDGGLLFTGQGQYTCGLVNPYTLSSGCYYLFADGSAASQQDLGGSEENFWTDWQASLNSNNLSSMAVNQIYKYNGGNYNLNFSIPTPTG
jgi:hypothetical protein